MASLFCPAGPLPPAVCWAASRSQAALWCALHRRSAPAQVNLCAILLRPGQRARRQRQQGHSSSLPLVPIHPTPV